VLAHDEKIDVAGTAIRQRRTDTGHQAHRPQVDVLVEFAAELDQRIPQRDMIRQDRGPAAGAEKYAIMAADRGFPVIRHPMAVLDVILATPVEGIELKSETEFA